MEVHLFYINLLCNLIDLAITYEQVYTVVSHSLSKSVIWDS